MGHLVAYDLSPFPLPLPRGHRFPAGKYRELRRCLQALPGLDLRTPPRSELKWILAVHEAGYVDRVLRGALSEAEERRIGLPWSRQLVERALRLCGAAVCACRDALAGRPGLVLGGGGHHARRGAGAGFCVFNDLAVAARFAQTQGVRRVLIVDCDVHQGDGTAELFADDPGVITFSIHARGNFPFTKARSDWDVEVPDGAGDDVYLGLLEPNLLAALAAARPELVLYVAGADPLAGDRLGRLALTPTGLRERDRMVLRLVCESGASVLVTLGGGYAEPITRTVRAHAGTVEEVLFLSQRVHAQTEGTPDGRRRWIRIA